MQSNNLPKTFKHNVANELKNTLIIFIYYVIREWRFSTNEGETHFLWPHLDFCVGDFVIYACFVHVKNVLVAPLLVC